MPLLNPVLNQVDQAVDIRGRCMAGVDDEIGVHVGDFSSSNAGAFEPELFNQLACLQRFGLRKTLPQLGWV